MEAAARLARRVLFDPYIAHPVRRFRRDAQSCQPHRVDRTDVRNNRSPRLEHHGMVRRGAVEHLAGGKLTLPQVTPRAPDEVVWLADRRGQNPLTLGDDPGTLGYP